MFELDRRVSYDRDLERMKDSPFALNMVTEAENRSSKFLNYFPVPRRVVRR